MKWVLRIAGALALLLMVGVLVLLGMGRRENANRMSAAVEIAAPPDRVWEWVTDPARLKQWVSWMVDARVDGAGGVGARSIWTMRDENNGGQLMVIHGEYSAYEPPHRLTVRLSADEGFDGEQTYRIADLGGGRSRVEIEMRYRLLQWFARLMEPVVTPMAEKKLISDLARLKSMAESAAQ